MTQADLKKTIVNLIISDSDPSQREEAFAKVRAFQELCVPALARSMHAFGSGAGVPTDAFRYQRIAAHASEKDRHIFRTSGTTAISRGQHHFANFDLYDLAAKKEAKRALFADVKKMKLIFLAPHYRETPDSSLSYMLSRFETWFASESTWIWQDGALHARLLLETLQAAIKRGEPVALLGTSFAFVHALDHLEKRRFQLPKGSRIMQTGGFKGKSRALEAHSMRESLAQTFGIAPAFIIAEYGMTELSSQFYENTLADALSGLASGRRFYRVPTWTRVEAVNPLTFEALPRGQSGLLRIEDLANLDSCLAIQTSDLATVFDDGFVLHGRFSQSPERGCSLAADQLLNEQICRQA